MGYLGITNPIRDYWGYKYILSGGKGYKGSNLAFKHGDTRPPHGWTVTRVGPPTALSAYMYAVK